MNVYTTPRIVQIFEACKFRECLRYVIRFRGALFGPVDVSIVYKGSIPGGLRHQRMICLATDTFEVCYWQLRGIFIQSAAFAFPCTRLSLSVTAVLQRELEARNSKNPYMVAVKMMVKLLATYK